MRKIAPITGRKILVGNAKRSNTSQRGARATRHGARPSSLTVNLQTMPPTLELQIERAGDGKNYPRKGDNVSVHYTMRLSSGREVDN